MPIIQGGRFTSDGSSKTLTIRTGVDYIMVRNITQAGTNQTTALGVDHYWQRGFPNGAQYMQLKSNAANAANLTQYLTTGGFTLVDTSTITPAALNNGSTGISNITDATPPVVTVGSTSGMSAGAIVRLYEVAGYAPIGGIDATIGNDTFTGTTFSLDYFSTFGAGVGATGDFRVIPFDVQYYPPTRYISKVSTGSTTTITLSVRHNYTVGQVVRIDMPSEFGMVQIDGLEGTITAVDTSVGTNTITVDIDSQSFTAFTYPSNGDEPLTWAQVVPVGEDTAYEVENNISLIQGASRNNELIGIRLAGGANLPGGASNDVMYWVAGTFDRINNN